jgi:hypothetical protein
MRLLTTTTAALRNIGRQGLPARRGMKNPIDRNAPIEVSLRNHTATSLGRFFRRRLMKRTLNPLRCFLIVFFLFTSFSSVFGWGPKGHEIANQAAIDKAPIGGQGFPNFFKSHENAAWIVYLAMEPDRWTGSGEAELIAGEASNHFLDFELLKGAEMPKDRLAAIGFYGSNGYKPGEVGYLPYTILEMFEKLKVSFREYRNAKKSRQTTLPMERNATHYAGVLGHYVVDGAQPLHLTIKYDAWNGDNPNGYRTEKGLHAKFETAFVDKFVTAAPVQANVTAPRLLDDPPKAVNDLLHDSFSLVETVYQLEKRGELDHPSESAKSFVAKRLAVGSQMLLDLWWTAWKKTES